MQRFLLTITLGLFAGVTTLAGDKEMTGPLSYTLKNIDDKDVELSKFKGKVVLLVNVASECGYTPQYEGLQSLYEKYKDDGLVVVGIPANDFGKQEPGSNAEILEFCQSKYKVTFPMMAKVVVKGEGQTPLYEYLTSEKTDPNFAGPVKWNFEKFLINRDGKVMGRYKSNVEPMSDKLQSDVKKALAEKK